MAYQQRLRITDLAAEDRPREKLLKNGISSLSDAELIAVLIGSGSTEETAVELARRILKGAGNNLNRLGKCSVAELKKYKGIGEAKAIAIAAAMEIGRRRKLPDAEERKQIKTSRDVFEIMHPHLFDLQHEEFWVIFLNRANLVIEETRISKGGMSGTVTDVKIILKEAIDKRASGLLLIHNHPSGNTRPSKADFNITRKLKNAAAYFDIQILDHLIIGENSYYSFADEGTL